MNFEIFDSLECECGGRELRLQEPVFGRAPAQDIVDCVLCKRFCGYKQCQISLENVNPDDCRKCRSTVILGGVVRCGCGHEWAIHDGSPQFCEASAPPFDEHGRRIVRIHPRTDPRWRSFVATHPEGTIFHHPGWLQALTGEYDRGCTSLACEDEDGRLHGVLPLLHTRGLPSMAGQRTTRRISSLPRTSVAGPLSTDQHATNALLRAAVELARKEHSIQLEIKTQTRDFDNLVEGLVRVNWNPSYVLELPSNPEELQLGDSRSRRHHIRGAVKKALNSGVQVRPADTEQELRNWYELYLDTMRRKVVPARPYRLFASMWRTLRPRGLMELLIAEKHGVGCPQLLAGSIFLKLGATVSYSFTGCHREDFSFHPHDLIQWHAIHDATKLGFRHYDFGEVAGDAGLLANFKSKWGAKESNLFRYYYPAPQFLEHRTLPMNGRWDSMVRAAWQRLPLSVTASIGDALYRFL
jgi:CelD/BcsL family acetyltransferase involved in cellulose biosynthesis